MLLYRYITKKNANLSGVCLDSITSVFPKYPLKGDIKNVYFKFGGNVDSLPRLPSQVDGDSDLMIGVQYLKYYPQKIFGLPNGLSIYKSQFVNSDGSRGVVAEPHRIFSEIHTSLGNNHIRTSAYFQEITKFYKLGYQHCLDTCLLGFPSDLSDIMFVNNSVTPINLDGESEEKLIDDQKTRNEAFLVKRAPKNYNICGKSH